ncbi:MAG: VOC family protein [Bacteroidetes bacterium]|nr:VOC family protein [Bacteroidota bacterium]
MDTLSPNIFVKDINKTIDFYRQLGFELITTVPDKGDYVWAMMTCGKVTFMFQTFDSLADTLPAISRQDGGSLLFYIGLKNIRTFFDSIKDKVTVVKGLEKAFYGATEFSITDNNGYVLTFAEDE